MKGGVVNTYVQSKEDNENGNSIFEGNKIQFGMKMSWKNVV